MCISFQYRDEEKHAEEEINKKNKKKDANDDGTKKDEEKNADDKEKKKVNLPPRLMIAVGVPAYKVISTNGTRNYTGLLGVASTDVPVDDIDKLTLPYKVCG